MRNYLYNKTYKGIIICLLVTALMAWLSVGCIFIGEADTSLGVIQETQVTEHNTINAAFVDSTQPGTLTVLQVEHAGTGNPGEAPSIDGAIELEPYINKSHSHYLVVTLSEPFYYEEGAFSLFLINSDGSQGASIETYVYMDEQTAYIFPEYAIIKEEILNPYRTGLKTLSVLHDGDDTLQVTNQSTLDVGDQLIITDGTSTVEASISSLLAHEIEFNPPANLGSESIPVNSDVFFTWASETIELKIDPSYLFSEDNHSMMDQDGDGYTDVDGDGISDDTDDYLYFRWGTSSSDSGWNSRNYTRNHATCGMDPGPAWIIDLEDQPEAQYAMGFDAFPYSFGGDMPFPVYGQDVIAAENDLMTHAQFFSLPDWEDASDRFSIAYDTLLNDYVLSIDSAVVGEMFAVKMALAEVKATLDFPEQGLDALEFKLSTMDNPKQDGYWSERFITITHTIGAGYTSDTPEISNMIHDPEAKILELQFNEPLNLAEALDAGDLLSSIRIVTRHPDNYAIDLQFEVTVVSDTDLWIQLINDPYLNYTFLLDPRGFADEDGNHLGAWMMEALPLTLSGIPVQMEKGYIQILP